MYTYHRYQISDEIVIPSSEKKVRSNKIVGEKVEKID